MAIRPVEQFQAHYDNSFGRLATTNCQKIARIAYDIISVLIPIIALVRYAAYKINQKISRMAMLPAMNQTPEQVALSKRAFFHFWEQGNGRMLPFTVESHRVATPDKAEISTTLLRHAQAGPDTPTLIYFNPNGAISYQAPFDEIMVEALRRNAVCNIAVFDYRGTGDSKGNYRSFDSLVIDGASVAQWVREKIGTPSDRIHFYGWSMGGAVSAHVKALNPENTPGDYASERSLSSSDDMIDAHLSHLSERVRNFVKTLSRWLGQSFNVVPAVEKLVGRILLILHTRDPVIPFHASIARRVQEIPHQEIRLEAVEHPNENHHVFPLRYYRDAATGNPAMEQIGQFLFN